LLQLTLHLWQITLYLWQIADSAREELSSEKPAETGQNAAPAKDDKESLWLVLYEKTLKVIVDAVLEKLWHR